LTELAFDLFILKKSLRYWILILILMLKVAQRRYTCIWCYLF